MFFADLGQQLDASGLGHALVGHDDVHRLALQQRQSLGRPGRAQHFIVQSQQVLDGGDDVALVVHDQDRVSLLHPPLRASVLAAHYTG